MPGLDGPDPPPIRTRLVLAAAVAAVGLAVAAAWIGLGRTDAAAPVRLEAVSEPGPASYTAPVGVDRADLVPPADPGGVRPGDSPSLYAHVNGSCDPAALAAALLTNGRAAAWARALDRHDGDAAAVLETLTSLVLRVDVLVDEHGWAGSGDSTHPAVLQAGSAVLVDDRGLPRVRCTSGNPLEPHTGALGENLAGTPWRWFAPSAVANVGPAALPLATFTAIDLDSGAAVRIPARH
jgi:hypothetical protein